MTPACPEWVSGSSLAGHTSMHPGRSPPRKERTPPPPVSWAANTHPLPPNPSPSRPPDSPPASATGQPPAPQETGGSPLAPHCGQSAVVTNPESGLLLGFTPHPPEPPGTLGRCPSLRSSPMCRPPGSHAASGGQVLLSGAAPGRGAHLHPARCDCPCAPHRLLRIFMPSDFCSFID